MEISEGGVGGTEDMKTITKGSCCCYDACETSAC